MTIQPFRAPKKRCGPGANIGSLVMYADPQNFKGELVHQFLLCPTIPVEMFGLTPSLQGVQLVPHWLADGTVARDWEGREIHDVFDYVGKEYRPYDFVAECIESGLHQKMPTNIDPGKLSMEGHYYVYSEMAGIEHPQEFISPGHATLDHCPTQATQPHETCWMNLMTDVEFREADCIRKGEHVFVSTPGGSTWFGRERHGDVKHVMSVFMSFPLGMLQPITYVDQTQPTPERLEKLFAKLGEMFMPVVKVEVQHDANGNEWIVPLEKE